eukprot:1160178-Pelagomonas_calceolata.AAC.11
MHTLADPVQAHLKSHNRPVLKLICGHVLLEPCNNHVTCEQVLIDTVMPRFFSSCCCSWLQPTEIQGQYDATVAHRRVHKRIVRHTAHECKHGLLSGEVHMNANIDCFQGQAAHSIGWNYVLRYLPLSSKLKGSKTEVRSAGA